MKTLPALTLGRKFFGFLVVFLFVCFWTQGFSVSPGYPRTHSADQAGFKLRDSPASASQVLGLKACVTTAQQEKEVLCSKNAVSLLELIPFESTTKPNAIN